MELTLAQKKGRKNIFYQDFKGLSKHLRFTPTTTKAETTLGEGVGCEFEQAMTFQKRRTKGGGGGGGSKDGPGF